MDDDRRPLPPGEVGAEAARGPCLFVGCFKRPEITAAVVDEEGWFYSGDLCTMDEEGDIRIVGRKKDMIIRGGTNISPREVEEILFTHPKVLNVAIVGMPDARMGERNIAPYNLPERLEVMAAFPVTPSGKIGKAAPRDDSQQRMGDAQA